MKKRTKIKIGLGLYIIAILIFLFTFRRDYYDFGYGIFLNVIFIPAVVTVLMVFTFILWE